jgi:hypothetical protein
MACITTVPDTDDKVSMLTVWEGILRMVCQFPLGFGFGRLKVLHLHTIIVADQAVTVVSVEEVAWRRRTQGRARQCSVEDIISLSR